MDYGVRPVDEVPSSQGCPGARSCASNDLNGTSAGGVSQEKLGIEPKTSLKVAGILATAAVGWDGLHSRADDSPGTAHQASKGALAGKGAGVGFPRCWDPNQTLLAWRTGGARRGLEEKDGVMEGMASQ